MSQLSDMDCWLDPKNDDAHHAFMAECRRRKKWPGDNGEGWEWFLAGWKQQERHAYRMESGKEMP